MAKLPTISAAYIKARAASRPGLNNLQTLLNGFRPALVSAFDVVNGRASSFTLDASDAIVAAIDAEHRLTRDGVTVANRAGASVTVRAAGPASKAYKYTARGTQVTLRRTAKGDWQLVQVVTIELRPGQPGSTRYGISAATAADITRHALRDYDS